MPRAARAAWAAGRPLSLRARILLLTVGATAVVLLLLIVPMGLLLQRGAAQDAERKASDVAQGVADYLSTGVTDQALLTEYVDRVQARNEGVRVGVLLTDGTRLGTPYPGGRTGSGPEDEPGDFDRGDQDHRGGRGRLSPTATPVTQRIANGRLVTIEVATPNGADLVQAGVSDAEIRSATWTRLALLGGVALVLLMLAATVAEWVSRRLVRDLTAASRVADRLAEGDLSARVDGTGPPEVQHVGDALNRLAARIDDLLQAERETVADLSHRLRTPLMAVRLDVESLPPGDRADELQTHLDHVERTLTAVIRAARRTDREGVRPRTDATAAVRERVAYWAPLADDQGRTIDVDAPDGELEVRVPHQDLRTAIDALLENAVAHTPEGTPLQVRLGLHAAGDDPDVCLVSLEVRDRGPGVPPDAVRRGRSDRGSTGLGLDIARTTATAGGGRLELDRVDGWSVVRLVLRAD